MAQNFYQEDEAEAILRLAAKNSSGGTVSRDSLLATASELGISAEEIEHAEQTLTSQRNDAELRRQFRKHVWSGFYTHLVGYIVLNLFLVGINALTGIREFWAIWPIMGTAFGLVCHLGNAFIESASDSRFERWKARPSSRTRSKPHELPRVEIGLSVRAKRPTRVQAPPPN